MQQGSESLLSVMGSAEAPSAARHRLSEAAALPSPGRCRTGFVEPLGVSCLTEQGR